MGVMGVGAMLACSKGASRPMGDGVDANVKADADADANSDANADANADAGAEAGGEVRAGHEAGVIKAGAGDAGGSKSVQLDEAGEGKAIDLVAGAQLVLLLRASPTSGFDWSVVKAPPGLGTPEMGYIAPPGEGMDAPGKRRIVWTLKAALPAGEHAVELGYRRGFEQGTPPLKTFRFKVRSPH